LADEKTEYFLFAFAELPDLVGEIAKDLEGVVSQIISDFPDQVGQFREGKQKILGFFVGQVMKATNGKANPKQVNEILRRELRP
jgi:Asp-tRNA(Asn)/Glu-tRNA(Gln) amidotransferase B subunit